MKQKYVLTIIILVVIISGGILGYWYWWLPKHEAPRVEAPETGKPEKELRECFTREVVVIDKEPPEMGKWSIVGGFCETDEDCEKAITLNKEAIEGMEIYVKYMEGKDLSLVFEFKCEKTSYKRIPFIFYPFKKPREVKGYISCNVPSDCYSEDRVESLLERGSEFFEGHPTERNFIDSLRCNDGYCETTGGYINDENFIGWWYEPSLGYPGVNIELFNEDFCSFHTSIFWCLDFKANPGGNILGLYPGREHVVMGVYYRAEVPIKDLEFKINSIPSGGTCDNISGKIITREINSNLFEHYNQYEDYVQKDIKLVIFDCSDKKITKGVFDADLSVKWRYSIDREFRHSEGRLRAIVE